MILILEKIYYFFYLFFPCCFGIAFIGFILFLATNSMEKFSNRKSKLKNIGIIMFAQIFLLEFFMIILQSILTNHIRTEFVEILKNKNTLLVQDNNTFGKFSSVELKNELLNVKNFEPHHSHPENEMSINVISNYGNFIITVGQDSNEKNEYWIFSNKYKFSSDNEIGRINSELFK